MAEVMEDVNNKHSKGQAQDVSVRMAGFTKLATSSEPLVLDNYQRAYVWDHDKVTQLLDDLAEFVAIESQAVARQYYLGTLLLHRKADQSNTEHCVIDGQQRLTTLAVLYWLLQDALPAFIQFEFRSSLSLANVQQARNSMLTWLDKHPQALASFAILFDHLCFTVITVTREDLAFTFFDTQNNRGVPLGSTDLLKAYHLRAIQDGDVKLVEQLQSHCARKWEQVQQCGELAKKSRDHDFAPDLFHYYLWRARNWRGADVKELESREEILSHFGEQSREAEIGRVALYPAGANVWGKALQLTAANDYKLTPASQHLGQQVASLPFSLRQPISRGVGFFLYTEKYAELIQQLLFADSFDPEIMATQRFYKQVVSTLSVYLQSLFRLALLMYFDRLGSRGLLRFAIYLDHRLGALRLLQTDIRRQTPLKFLREAKRNLLDVIAHAYEGDEVIWFLQQLNVDSAYAQNDGWQNEIKDNGNKVQQRYVKALAGYYQVSRLSGKTAAYMDEKVRAELQGPHLRVDAKQIKDAFHG